MKCTDTNGLAGDEPAGPIVEAQTTEYRPPYKYKEDELLQELREYIESTYKGHYIGEDNIQSLDLIFATGHGIGFCIGNILKYAARFARKKTTDPNDDLLKILHYALLAQYLYNYKHQEK